MFQAQQNKNNNNNRNNSNGTSYLSVNMPNSTNQQQPGCLQNASQIASQIFPSYKLKSFTTANVALIYLMYIICHIWYYTQDMNWKCTTHFFGSHYGPDVGQQYQFHRLFTPLFLHQNNMHIFFNTLGLLFFGFELERYYGMWRFIVMYVMAAIGGNLLSIYYHYHDFALGASTSVFGVLALQCIYVFEQKESLGPRFGRVLLQLVFILGINLVQSISDPVVDGAAHLGGFIFGGMVGLLFLNYDWIKKRRWLKMLIIILLVIITIVLTYLVLNHPDSKNASTFDQLSSYNVTINSSQNKVANFCSKEAEQSQKKYEQKQQQKNNPF